MLGDFGGGGMFLAFGLLSALIHARVTGRGQVVDAAIVDGTALFTSMLQTMRARGGWDSPRGRNLFDGGAPYYGTFRTRDDKWAAVGAIEPQLYAQLVAGLGLKGELPLNAQDDRAAWPAATAPHCRESTSCSRTA
jgi:alpha-methylacyl-CoA racemase